MGTVKELVNKYQVDYTFTPYFKEKQLPDGDTSRTPSVIILMSNDNTTCDIFVKCKNTYYNIAVYRNATTSVEVWLTSYDDRSMSCIAKYPRLAEYIDREYPELTVGLAHVIAEKIKAAINRMLDDKILIGGINSKLKRKSARG